MAVKSKLHTEFTGDSRPFEKASRKAQASAKKTISVFRGMGGALAAVGAGVGFRSILDKMDRIGKVARRMEISAESVQRLGFAATQAGASFESLQAIMTRLERRTGEAMLNSTSAAAQAFGELGINLKEISKLNIIDKFLLVSDAFANANDKITVTASLMKLLDTEVRELIPLMQQSGHGIAKVMESANVATNEAVTNAEKAKEFFGALGQNSLAVVGAAVSGWDWLIKDTAEDIRSLNKEWKEFTTGASKNIPDKGSLEERAQGRLAGLEAEKEQAKIAAEAKAAADKRRAEEVRPGRGAFGVSAMIRGAVGEANEAASERGIKAAKILHEMQMKPIVKGVNKVGEGIEGFFNRLGNGVQATTQKVAELKQKAGEFTEKVREEFPSAQADYPTSANFIGTEDDPFSSGGRAAGGKFGVYSPKALGASSARTGANSPIDKLRTEQDRQAREQRNLTSDLVAETTRLREFFADKLN